MRSSVATMMPPRSRACLVTVRTYAPDEDAAVTARAVSPAAMSTSPSTVVVTSSLVPPPPAFTNVALTPPATATAPKVVAKPPLPVATSTVNGVAKVNGASTASSTTITANGVTRVNGVGGASSAGIGTNGIAKVNGVAKVNGTNSSSATSANATPTAATNGITSIQQVRLRPIQPQQLQAQQQRLTHRTPSPAPYCPTPDYDSDSSGSTLHTASTGWTAKAVAPQPGAGAGAAVAAAPEVEMQSLDSLELLEPRARQPRPPQTYFQQNRGAPAARPSVSVTIREYGGGNSRQPSKLTFLNGAAPNGNGVNGNGAVVQEGLQSELAATLSRSNLRCRTDVIEAAGDEESSEAPKALDDVSRGNVTVTSVNGSAGYLPKSNVPNGILKKAPGTHMVPNGLPVGHGITPALLAGAGAALKTKSSGISTKSITFGAKATIINEKQVPT